MAGQRELVVVAAAERLTNGGPLASGEDGSDRRGLFHRRYGGAELMMDDARSPGTGAPLVQWIRIRPE